MIASPIRLAVLVRVACAVVAAVVPLSFAAAQSPRDLQINIEQKPNAGGTLLFSIRPPLLSGGPQATVFAPDGTNFAFGNPGFVDLPFSTFAARAFGEWTIREPRFSGPNSFNIYHFTLTPFTLESIYHDTPIVTTPVGGGFVPMSFPVEWTFPTPNSLTGRAISYSPGIHITTQFAADGSRHVDVNVGPTGRGVAHTLRAGGLYNFADHFTPVVGVPPLSAPGPTNFVIRSNFFLYSAAFTATPVPEPSALTLIAIAAGYLRRRAAVRVRASRSTPIARD